MPAPGRLDTAVGLTLGACADRVFADPRRHHPVAGYGRLAAAAERRLYRPTRVAGALHTATCLAAVVLPAAAAEWALDRQRQPGPTTRAAILAAVVWLTLGGTTLTRQARALGTELAAGDLAAARARLPQLCGRDPAGLDATGLARAGVESVAENTCDAVVAPLVWGALAGLPGLVGYRAVNTLDAMVGYRDSRYARFGTAAARLDDAANFVPARLTAALAVLLAPLAGGRPNPAWRTWRSDGHRHPSPNAGHPEAAFAGALGLRLGGPLRYPHGAEDRPVLGTGRPPVAADLDRAARLCSAVTAAATLLTAAAAAAQRRRRR
ncbi:MAG: cobalamin biosynthesis protein [Mycobacteriales bacterium]